MTTTATKTQKTKAAPFPSQPPQGRTLRSPLVAAPVPITSRQEQERLSDWDHAS